MAAGGAVRSWRGPAFSGRCWSCMRKGDKEVPASLRRPVRAASQERLRLSGRAVLARCSQPLWRRRGWGRVCRNTVRSANIGCSVCST